MKSKLEERFFICCNKNSNVTRKNNQKVDFSSRNPNEFHESKKIKTIFKSDERKIACKTRAYIYISYSLFTGLLTVYKDIKNQKQTSIIRIL